MDKSRSTAINFITWVGQFCIYVGDGFWIYYKKFYSAEDLFNKYEEWQRLSEIEKAFFEYREQPKINTQTNEPKN